MVVAGLDFGTQSVKLLVYDAEKKEAIALSSHPFDLITGEGGVREQEAEWFIDGLRDVFSKIPSDIRSRIRAIGVSGQQHGFVPLDSSGRVLAPVKLWCDTSTAGECRLLTSLYGSEDELIGKVGNALLPGYTVGKIFAFRRKKPDLFEKMAWVLLPHDYINWYLTGRAVMERGDASGTGLYNIYSEKWDEKLCSLIDESLIRKLPPVLGPEECIGKVRKEVAQELGLGNDVIVSTGGGDNMMSAIGTGTVSNGDLTMSLGTSGTLFAFSEKPVTDRKGRLAAFASSTGGFLPLLCTMNCTVATEKMRTLFSLDLDSYSAKAAKAPVGSEGLVLLPFFNGERVPNYPKGEGVLAGMNMTNVKEENICRVAMEGVSFGFLLGIEAFREAGFEPKMLTVTGGGSNSPVWRQMLSDITGLEVRVPMVKEAAAFGASLQALALLEERTAVDTVKDHLSFDRTKEAHPEKNNRALYMAAYEKWKSYSDTLRSLYE